MTSPTDAQMAAEADRRSQPAQPELTLSDAIRDYLIGQGRVPADHIEGVVIDGEVYDLAEWERGVKAKALREAASWFATHQGGVLMYGGSACARLQERAARIEAGGGL